MRKKHEACQLGKDSLLDLPKIRIHASVSLLPFLLVFFSPSKLITAAFDLSFNLAFTRQSKAYIFIYLYILCFSCTKVAGEHLQRPSSSGGEL